MAKRHSDRHSEAAVTGASPVREPHKRAGVRRAPQAPAETVAAPLTATPAAESTPTESEIARLAYSHWEARGRQGGSPQEDWKRAEMELRGQIRSHPESPAK